MPLSYVASSKGPFIMVRLACLESKQNYTGTRLQLESLEKVHPRHVALALFIILRVELGKRSSFPKATLGAYPA